MYADEATSSPSGRRELDGHIYLELPHEAELLIPLFLGLLGIMLEKLSFLLPFCFLFTIYCTLHNVLMRANY